MQWSIPRRSLRADPSALFQQALQRHQAGALAEAERLYRAVLAVRPDHVPALSNLGAALRDLERPADALASYDRALAIQPDHVWSLNNRGVALMDLGRPADALASFEAALALRPDYPEALNNRGKALASYDTVLAFGPEYARVAAKRGDALDRLMRPDQALESYDRAIALKPDYAEAHDNRGLLLFEFGYAGKAAAAVQRAIDLAPNRVRFHYHLAQIRFTRPGDPLIAALQALARDMALLGPDEQIELNFALAKALDDIGDHAGAFRRLLDGNALKRSRTAYDEAAVLGEMDRTRAAFPAALMHRGEGTGAPSDVPVFIVGMPRSGTSLVEQILAAHPKVFAAGETDALRQAMTARHPDIAFPEGASQLAGPALADVGAGYVDWVRAAAPGAERITNKRPDNFRHLGLIHLALPNARIIHLRRDPLDTCVSCFSKLFGDDLAYSFDLGELGRYHRAYEALMAHWREVMPAGVMLEVRYEDLVADLEGQARRLLAHCGLEWDARCLDFHLVKRRLRTASAGQVRLPLYASSVGRWRAYEAFLGPLLEVLARPGLEEARARG